MYAQSFFYVNREKLKCTVVMTWWDQFLRLQSAEKLLDLHRAHTAWFLMCTFMNRSADQWPAPQIYYHHHLVLVCIHSEDNIYWSKFYILMFGLIFIYLWGDVATENSCYFTLLMLSAFLFPRLWRFRHFFLRDFLLHHLHHLVTWNST